MSHVNVGITKNTGNAEKTFSVFKDCYSWHSCYSPLHLISVAYV